MLKRALLKVLIAILVVLAFFIVLSYNAEIYDRYRICKDCGVVVMRKDLIVCGLKACTFYRRVDQTATSRILSESHGCKHDKYVRESTYKRYINNVRQNSGHILYFKSLPFSVFENGPMGVRVSEYFLEKKDIKDIKRKLKSKLSNPNQKNCYDLFLEFHRHSRKEGKKKK